MDHSIEQLAMFMNARDARDYGTATWDALDVVAREAYMADAKAFVSAMTALGWRAPEGENDGE